MRVDRAEPVGLRSLDTEELPTGIERSRALTGAPPPSRNGGRILACLRGLGLDHRNGEAP
ncbi:hypothetical protein [Streptomyces sp900116325]|uniref:hypothetical protein n=1 Tax=Streptomyces sp. 900116325 TaxID=3154295 RepID=UPI00331E1040